MAQPPSRSGIHRGGILGMATRRICARGLIALGLAIGAAFGTSATAEARTDYATASFQVTDHPYAFGQAPVFMPNGQQVVFGKNFQQGDGNQVYMSNLDG